MCSVVSHEDHWYLNPKKNHQEEALDVDLDDLEEEIDRMMEEPEVVERMLLAKEDLEDIPLMEEEKELTEVTEHRDLIVHPEVHDHRVQGARLDQDLVMLREHQDNSIST